MDEGWRTNKGGRKRYIERERERVKRLLKEHGGPERPLEALADAVEERKG